MVDTTIVFADYTRSTGLGLARGLVIEQDGDCFGDAVNLAARLSDLADRRGNNYILEDLNSYGAWVRFACSDSIVALRRQGCTLPGNGEIALGASFDDFRAPCIGFAIQGAPEPNSAS